MANPNGNAAALVPAPEGNTYALKHGAYSDAGLSERAAEVLAEIMALEHVVPFDLPAARELARLTAMAERIDAALEDGRVENRKGQVRALLDQRRRLSAQLLNLYTEFGMTPKARADVVAKLRGSSLDAEIRRRLAEVAERERRR